MSEHNGSAEERRKELAHLIAVLSDEELERIHRSARMQRNVIIAIVAVMAVGIALAVSLAVFLTLGLGTACG